MVVVVVMVMMVVMMIDYDGGKIQRSPKTGPKLRPFWFWKKNRLVTPYSGTSGEAWDIGLYSFL